MIESPAEKATRLACIPNDIIDWLIVTSKPDRIAYERQLMADVESLIDRRQIGPESWQTILDTHCRMLRRLENELAELETERDRRAALTRQGAEA
jgi:hypothetical protein